MTSLLSSRSRLLATVGVFAVVASLIVGFFLWRRSKTTPLPSPGSPQYEEYAQAFQLGTAALDASRDDLALKNLNRAIDLIPQEPAAWANRGLLHLRANRPHDLEEADRDLKKAAELAPNNAELERLLAMLAERRGAFDEAVSHLRKVVEGKPRDLPARFALAQLIDRAAADDSDAEYQKLMEDILRVQPNNLKVLAERARIAVRRLDNDSLSDTLTRLNALAVNWSPDAREQLRDVLKASAKPLPGDVPLEMTKLDNLLRAELAYQRGASAVLPNASGESLQQFLKLAPLRTVPDAPDHELTFTAEPPAGLSAEVARERWNVALTVWLTGNKPPVVFVANATGVRRVDGVGAALAFPAGKDKTPPTADGVLALDWNNDERNDLLFAGAGGLKFWKQDANGAFTDVTAKTGLSAAILGGDYVAAWAADIEMDGDLDIVLARRTGSPIVLRNNLDGTFKVIEPFSGVDGLRSFVWADFDNDGAPDAALLDAKGRLHVFSNERSGQFRARRMPEALGLMAALAAADVTDDGVFDLLALRLDGGVLRLSDLEHGRAWQVEDIARRPDSPGALEPGRAKLLTADLDNNGMLDLIAVGPRGSRVWLGDGLDTFAALPVELDGQVSAAEDMTGKGRLDLIALTSAGQPTHLVNRGTKDYHWQEVRPYASRGKEISGDNRINSFGIGGEMEARAGSLVQKQIIASPRVHFGLGKREKCQVIRIVWPNGYAQVEFPEGADQAIAAEQRLKGSCPFLFAWDGERISFVTDFMWSTPLGMYINGQDKDGFLQTQDWVKIGGERMKPRDGAYDIRVNANLWETHFFDHMSLIVVDRPAATEMFVDERFALEPMTPQVHLTATPHPVALARDTTGKDVTDIIRAIDGRYLDVGERGRYQGVARDHWVEVDLGDDAPREGPLWLLANGWIHPTDSSINVAIGQGKHDAPRGLVLEVPDDKGGWKVGSPALGFPAGKNKTMMIRLDGITGKGVTRRFRLRTNMEIYWDALHYAVGLEAKDARQRRLAPEKAELRYRGILEMTQADDSSPELPHYDRVDGVGQPWRDPIGFYTRYGDVRELLAGIDDRFVIMNAGDEIVVRFAVPEGPPAGWKRDFVWVCEGWIKDGDLNTRFSKTVLPLPAHDQKSYNRPPTRLKDDPIYRRFPDDWRKYHTRYVAPHAFERGLRSFRRTQP